MRVLLDICIKLPFTPLSIPFVEYLPLLHPIHREPRYPHCWVLPTACYTIVSYLSIRIDLRLEPFFCNIPSDIDLRYSDLLDRFSYFATSLSLSKTMEFPTFDGEAESDG